jgi:proteasome lid subunit RPN8/RPN11
MATQIEQKILDSIQDHLERTYPFEACGFLLGSEKNGVRNITKSIEAENKSTENQRRRFVIDPLDYMRTEKLALKENLSLIGIYHSHPDEPAIPSLTDLEYAQPNFSYFIFSIISGKLTDLQSFRLNGKIFVEENLTITKSNTSDHSFKIYQLIQKS